MRLFNTVIVLDAYTVAESPEKAREAALAMLQSGDVQPSEAVAIEVRNEREVREAWRSESPIVAEDVSDADFGRVKGKKTLDVFQMLHTKKRPEAEAK